MGRRPDGFWRAEDTRLGRTVFLHRTSDVSVASRINAVVAGGGVPATAVLLDAGHDESHGTRWAYSVYPAGDRPTLAELLAARSGVDPARAAALAVRLVTAGASLRRRAGAVVPLDARHVLVDPDWWCGGADDRFAPVQWMPVAGAAVSARSSDRALLHDVVGAVLRERPRDRAPWRHAARLTRAGDLLAATTVLAELAGPDGPGAALPATDRPATDLAASEPPTRRPRAVPTAVSPTVTVFHHLPYGAREEKPCEWAPAFS